MWLEVHATTSQLLHITAASTTPAVMRNITKHHLAKHMLPPEGAH